ncbi:hypothetical protein THIOM_001457 [Candidatus Thiomargarita nelsonii]|uniref:Uncharacterized protein n=1 Tax=Candidatus Thiomargarita nelsonii TaxID=1003181 RepID=A0A176S482_9GAMM|nr:hypothetical protein THIOM_001457 [Candidatus Thiomargarita nelsonii]
MITFYLWLLLIVPPGTDLYISPLKNIIPSITCLSLLQTLHPMPSKDTINSLFIVSCRSHTNTMMSAQLRINGFT